MTSITIRRELPQDRAAVREVVEAAFETPAEATLVQRLQAASIKSISLVAETGGEIVGHILFTSVTSDRFPDARIAGLAPMAVHPDWQNQGIGSALVNHGVTECSEESYEAVVVLGHAEYYPRFGFVPASRMGIQSEYDVPDEVFMVMELTKNFLAEPIGLVRYHPFFQAE